MARYWMSFDLGLGGNYEALYSWLDELNASECGDSAATFITAKQPAQIARELSKLLGQKARVYLIFTDKNAKATGPTKGKFIVGRRRRAPWEGYAPGNSEEEWEEG